MEGSRTLCAYVLQTLRLALSIIPFIKCLCSRFMNVHENVNMDINLDTVSMFCGKQRTRTPRPFQGAPTRLANGSGTPAQFTFLIAVREGLEPPSP